MIEHPFFGEVINGRMWVGDEWVPVDGLKPGDVVGDRMWTGTAWVAATPPPPPPPRPKSDPLWKRWWFILILAFVFLATVDMITSPDEPAAAPGPVAEDTVEEEPDPEVPGLDDPVVDGDLEFTVVDVDADVDDIGGSFNQVHEPEGSFTLVEMEVKNVGDNPAHFTWSNVEGTATGDVPVPSNAVGSYYANPTGQAGPFIRDLNPGAKIEVTIVFDVPTGKTLETVIGHDSMYSDGAEIHIA